MYSLHMREWSFSSDNKLCHSRIVEGEICWQFEKAAKLQSPLDFVDGGYVQHHSAAKLEKVLLPESSCAPSDGGGTLLMEL